MINKFVVADSIFDRKYSLFDFILILLFASISLYFYQDSVTKNILIENLTNQSLEYKNIIETLKQEISVLNQRLILLEQSLKDNILILEQNKNTSLVTLENSTIKDSIEVIRERNNMRQFNMLFFGGIALGLTALYYFNYGFTFPTLKYFIPTSIYSFLQDNVSYFQKLDNFVQTDDVNKIIWLMKIKNNKTGELFGKFVNSGDDYVKCTEFVKQIMANSHALVPSPDIVANIVNNPVNSKVALNVVDSLNHMF